MAIPHQDKLVYNRIAPGQAQQPVERLLPPPEAPVDRPAPPAEPPADPAAGASPPMPPDATAPPAPAPPATSSGDTIAKAIVEAGKDAGTAGESGATPFVRTPDASTTAPEPPPAPAAAPPPDPAPQLAAVPPPAPAANASGPAWRIQLASLTSEAAARSEWQRMQKANEDLLGRLQLSLQTARLEKGTYHRIQAGPLADRAAADAVCSALKARKQDCLVVAP
jgi:cell division septation protein DedD